MTSYLTPAEYADRAGVHVDTVHAWIRSGRLKAIDISTGSKRRHWRITPEQIAEFEAAATGEAPSPAPVRTRREAPAYV